MQKTVDRGLSVIRLLAHRRRPKSFGQICKYLQYLGLPQVLSTRRGYPTAPPGALARPLNPRWLAWSQVPFSLSLHPCPQACGSLPVYVGVLGYAWGNGPICLGDVSDGNLGFRTLPDLPIALGNGPGVDFLNALSSDYWTASCMQLPLWLQGT